MRRRPGYAYGSRGRGVLRQGDCRRGEKTRPGRRLPCFSNHEGPVFPLVIVSSGEDCQGNQPKLARQSEGRKRYIVE